jgi:hypothetical protein
MAVEWQNLRVPKALHARLAALAADMLASYEERGGSLPSEYCERVPLHYVIERALDELDGHKTRARQQAKRNARGALDATPGEGMYTSPKGASE